ncbi:MAG: dTMP kinase [Candidatus Bathyarchaeota archaeon]|jgi:dTMP kinase|nr:dTMP kinase [Candidatus Bathyarchaeota archaeon]
MVKRGVFICLEGIDASGKSTQARWLVRNLRRRGFDAIYTTEPSDGEIGRFIKRFVLQRKRRIPAVVEALLFAVDRVDHVESKIERALESGKIVVSDRYVYSSLAYQGATGLDIDWIKGVNRMALPPDLAIYIDVPPEVVVERMKRKRSVMETLATQCRVREVYMQLVREKRLLLIDGNRPAPEVAQNILNVVLKHLKRA